MYSSVAHPQQSYTVYTITVDKQKLRSYDFPDQQREVVYNTIAAYDGLRQMDWSDTLDRVISHRFMGINAQRFRASLLNGAHMDTPYQKWLFQYIADMRIVKTPVIEVARQRMGYMPDGTLIPVDTPRLVFKLRDE